MIGIYFYSVSYGTMEGGEKNLLWSENYYTKDQWKHMVFEAIAKTIREEIGTNSYVHDYESLHGHVIQLMLRDYDVHTLPIQESVQFFGWGSVFDKEDWSSNRGQELDELTDYLLKQGFTKDDDSSNKYKALYEKDVNEEEDVV